MPAASLSALTLSLALYFAPRGFNAGFVDMAHDGYQLRQALDLHQGGTLFRDTFDQYGLLTPYFNQVGFVAFGQRLLAIKYFVALWYGATAIVMYVLARRFVGVTLGAFSVLLWLGLAPFYQHGVMLSPHAYVLLFQASAMILAIGDTDGKSRWRWWVVGGLCGVCWLFKQSLGTLFFAAFALFVLSTPRRGRPELRSAARRLVDLSAGFAVVVVASLAWLFERGALHDWYLQTIVFPRTFYLSYYRDTGTGGTAAWSLAQLFFRLQAGAAGYWLALRAVVIGAGAFALLRSTRDDGKVVLAAWVTLLLWLAAFPSANYMHQWWTISLSLCAAVYALRRTIGALGERLGLPARILPAALTIAAIGLLAWPGLATRWNDGWGRVASPSEAIIEPRSLSGIRTDPAVRRSIAALYQTMVRFRLRHPGAPVLSIDSHEGVSDNAESLLLLSFFEDNRHPGPIYWNLPVLSTVVYASHAADFLEFVRHEQPLIVDYQSGGDAAKVVPEYYLLATAPTPDGDWFVYAPQHADAQAHGEPAVEPPPVNAQQEPAAPAAEYVMTSMSGRETRARLHTVSSAVPAVPADLASLPAGVEAPANATDEVLSLAPVLVVNGPAASPDSYLLQLNEKFLKKGDAFAAVGVVEEGGMTVGLQRGGFWAGFVNVTEPGPFVVVVAAPEDGRYTLTVANCVTAPAWSARLGRHGILGATVGWFRNTLPNSFRIEKAGWVDAR